MSLFDGFTTSYTFQLQIERNDSTILDTTVAARATADEVAKAKKTLQRLLNEYTPVIQPPTPVPTPMPEQTEAPAPQELEAQEQPAQNPDAGPQEEGPVEAATPPQGASPARERPQQGARGLLRLHCRECGNTFVTYLRDRQTEAICRCGHHIDLTAPLAKYHYTCPYCEKDGWGQTNLEDPEITVRCRCGGDVDLRWNSEAKEYQN